MSRVDESAETLARCPRCQDQLQKSPEKACPLCEGSGLVSFKKALGYKSRARASSVPPAE